MVQASVAWAQAATPQSGQTGPTPTPGALQLPPVTVTAQKEPADAERLPISLTAIGGEFLDRSGAHEVSDVGLYAPNTFFSELAARKVSNPSFRGIRSSPSSPRIATFIDGVPHLNTSSSNIELIAVERVEFVRGAQSALFGRDALGGIINITSRIPSLTRWTGTANWESANYAGRGLEASLSGPISANKAAFSGSFGARRRDGFTENLATSSDVDSRSSAFGKAQIVWAPSPQWHTHVIVSAERDRDGDYALADLQALRANPFDVRRDFTGRTDRDVFSVAGIAQHEGRRLSISTTTGLVKWDTVDLTDLDYSPLPIVTRDNSEDAWQFTQEVRLASTTAGRPTIGSRPLGWQAGVFMFTQKYEQDAINYYSPFVLSSEPVTQHAPESDLDDLGVGLFGQATLSVTDRLEASVGARFDYESKDAVLNTYYMPQIGPDQRVTGSRGFSNLSPQLSLAYRLRQDQSLYVSMSEGFRAGGFNPASPAGSETYDEEHAWHVEGGFKSLWGNRRATLNASVFYIDWQDLQLNVPDPQVPAQFYIANVGAARSAGVEVEARVRAHAYLDLIGAVGQTASEFQQGSRSSDVDVSGNSLPGTPDYTATLAAETSVPLGSRASVYGRGEAVFYGAFKYDDLNLAGQDAFSLTNFRAGLRVGPVFVEAWIRNAFDRAYVPVAFPYQTPSGYLGEPGKPRTFGIKGGVGF
jgi:iron complex outermembrane receptor protein